MTKWHVHKRIGISNQKYVLLVYSEALHSDANDCCNRLQNVLQIFTK